MSRFKVRMDTYIKNKEYQQAYTLVLAALKDPSKNLSKQKEVDDCLNRVIASLRRECMALANNKATEFSKELKAKEALFRRFNELRG